MRNMQTHERVALAIGQRRKHGEGHRSRRRERRIATAHLTPQTKFINGFENLNNLPPVSEGIFFLL